MSNRDILTPEEREALLEGVTRGDVPTEGAGLKALVGVRECSFTSQEHILRGPMPTLDMINERFARHFRSSLYGLLQRPGEVKAGQVESMKFAEYVRRLTTPAMLHVVEMPPLEGTAVLLMDSSLVYTLVDGFFGGNGRAINDSESRDFTPSELRVATLVLKQLFKDMVTAWAPVMEVGFEHLKTETNARFVNVASPGESVLVARFTVGIGKNGGELHMVLSQSMIDPIREQLDGGVHSDRAGNDLHWAEALSQGLKETKVELKAVLLETELRLRDVRRLRAGDVIAVDLPEELPIYAEGVPVFMGVYGSYKGANAVKILRSCHAQAVAHGPGGAKAKV